ncbi:MAG: homoserine dehydrogenase [Gammaproteobacteria bacterium]|nr:homoserine dehydrogenase [Gammaproteobacteria bacterium]
MKVITVGLLGLGTVGGGTVNVLKHNAEEISRRCGYQIRVGHASARDITKARICDTSDIQLTTDPAAVVTHPDVDVVVELIGGDTLALEMVLLAIEHGKHVVTANKALIARHGSRIFAAASERGVMVAYEAAVAGGIPIIKALREGLAGNRIEWLAGIINGTGNFILTEMREKGRDFADVLREAQQLGYAEADPTFDVEGIDAAHKLTILASIAFGIPLSFSSVNTEGITKITREDVRNAEELGYRIKHLGIARRTDAGIELRVHPTLIPATQLIANVNGVMNAVLVKGSAVGPTLYYGAGAGSNATASAVVADIIDVARALNVPAELRIPALGFQPQELANTTLLPMDAVESYYYLRMAVTDERGVLAAITKILGDNDISIEALIQKAHPEGELTTPLVMLTHKVLEGAMNRAIAEIERLPSIHGQVLRIRTEPLQ